MATDGPKDVGTAADDAGTGNTAWNNPTNVVTDDGNFASASLGFVAPPDTSHYLVATNFGHGTSGTIDGIQHTWKKQDVDAGGHVEDNRVRVVKGGVIGSTDKSNAGTGWPTTAGGADVTHGSASDLWGETWSATDINASDYGAAISCLQDDSSFRTGRLYHCKSTVDYTAAAGVIYTQLERGIRGLNRGLFWSLLLPFLRWPWLWTPRVLWRAVLRDKPLKMRETRGAGAILLGVR